MKARFLLGCVAALLCTAAAPASPIVYTVSDIAAGGIGTRNFFADQLVTISFYGDTENVTASSFGGGGAAVTGPSSFYINVIGTGTVKIGSDAAVSFTDPVQFFDNQSFEGTGYAGISVVGGGSILDTSSSVFATYTGSTPIGPIVGPVLYNFAQLYNTTGGQLYFTQTGANSTFTATTAAAVTPEPSSLLLLGTGLLGTLGMLRRKLSANAI